MIGQSRTKHILKIQSVHTMESVGHPSLDKACSYHAGMQRGVSMSQLSRLLTLQRITCRFRSLLREPPWRSRAASGALVSCTSLHLRVIFCTWQCTPFGQTESHLSEGCTTACSQAEHGSSTQGISGMCRRIIFVSLPVGGESC